MIVAKEPIPYDLKVHMKATKWARRSYYVPYFYSHIIEVIVKRQVDRITLEIQPWDREGDAPRKGAGGGEWAGEHRARAAELGRRDVSAGETEESDGRQR